MEIFSGLFHGFYTALQPNNLMACFFGVLVGTLSRGTSGNRAGRRHVNPSAGNFSHVPDIRHYYAGRHILRFHVWRLYNINFG